MSGFVLTFPEGGMMGSIAPFVMALGQKLPAEFTSLDQAVGHTAFQAKDLYNDYLKGERIPGHGQLKRPYQGGGEAFCRPILPLEWEIGHTDGSAAKNIEEGTPEYDMKLGLPNSKKARQGKHGLYLIIPFRHGTPKARSLQAMPQRVYKQAVQLSFSFSKGVVGSRMSATGHEVDKYGYDWGGKLGAVKGPLAKPWHKGSIYSGMYRFKDQGTVKQSKAAGYITFRTMSQGSNPRSWIRPAIPGQYPLETAINEAWKQNQDTLNGGLIDDVARMITELQD